MVSSCFILLLHSDLGITPNKIVEFQEYYKVPPRHVAKFIGRDAIMATLEAALSKPSSEAPKVVVLHGMGGQGKTQIALKYCIRARTARKFFGTFWVEASSEKALKKSFEAIAEEIKPLGRQFQDEASILAFLDVTFQSWSRPWLMVLDNWDDVSAFSNLRDYIPKNKSCSIIITSRHVDSCRFGVRVEVPRMTESEAVDLLFHQADIAKAEPNEGYGRIIAERLGYLPLALDQAGAYIRKRKGYVSMDCFLEHYERRKKFVLHATPEVWEYRKKLNLAEMETSLSVATTWEMSMHQICTEDEAWHSKSDLLNLFAFFNHRKISENLFENYSSSELLAGQSSSPSWVQIFAESNGEWSSDLFEGVIVSFHDLSLIETFWRESDLSFHFSLHPLVKDWIQIRQGKRECQQSCFFAAQVLSAFLQNVYENQEFRLPFSTKQDVLQNVKAWDDGYKALIDPLQGVERQVLDAVTNSELCFADYYKQCGRLDEASDLYARVLEYKKIRGDNQQVILSVATKLGWIYEMQGRFSEAESSLRSACELGKTALGPKHPETLVSLNLLGLVLTDQGKYEEAAKLNSWILKVRESVLGTDHLDTLHSRHNLANNIIYLGLYKQGEEYHRQILSARQRILGKDHFDSLNTLCCLAAALHHQGFLEEAEELYREAYERSEAALGEEHLDTLDSLYKLATTVLRRGRAAEAEEICRKMIGTGERMLGPNHPLLLQCLHETARTLVAQGKYQAAKDVYLGVIEAREHSLPKGHPATMVSINELARCLYQYGDTEEASKAFQKVVASDELKLGKPHPLELLNSFGLASSVHSRRRYEQLMEDQSPKTDTSDQKPQNKKPSEEKRALDSTHRLANLFCDQGRYMEAEKAYRQEYEACQKIWGVGHERSLLCLFNLARVNFHQGKYKEALEIRAQKQALRQTV
jgi:tetratricopeptide (TPR) repeat protein